jgi:Zn-finger nucleic acid-binding protein
MTISDDEWAAAARARAAAGDWERPADAVFAELRAQADQRKVAAPPALLCPYCDSHPPLAILQRYELQTATPLRYCNNCYGFWAAGDSITAGLSEPGDGHPALHAARGPRRCRSCFGHLKPDGACAKCGKTLPPLNCPACGKVMERMTREGVQLDQCAPCTGVWFDTGEIAAVFKLEPAQGLAAATVDEHATDDDPPEWLTAAMVVGRMVLPFLPL